MDNNIDRNVSVKILRPKTKSLLSALLNPVKILPTDTGLPRYWRGLADLCNINGQYGPGIQNDSDPTGKVLALWSEKDQENSTISQFLSYLEQLDRFDIVDDITELIDEDIKVYNANPFDVQTQEPNLDMDKYILTRDDLMRINEGLALENYDAFVLFADEDISFATELIETMEKQYEMRFCVKDRDLVAGGLEYDKIVQSITQRCNRLIVILSDAFFTSSSNRFYLSFAQAYGIESKRKVIPCLYKACNLPPEMRCYFMLDYRRAPSFGYSNFWDRLRDSIKVTTPVNQQSLTRARSHNTPATLRSALHHESNARALRPIHQVKFNSMVNLNNCDNEQILPDQSLSASASSHSIGTYDKDDSTNAEKTKKTKKRNWIKKWLHINGKRKATAVAN